MRGSRIALCVCGGIAAYKVAGLARELTQAGAEVHVVMTPSACEFVGPLTFSTLTGNPVRTELFPESAPTEIAHTDLGRTSDLVIVAPATAKTIAKSAQGLSDDLMSALLLSARCPVLMAPAMHTEMWFNDATQANVATMVGRGVRMVGPAVGALAGPDVGVGRMASVEEIIAAAEEELALRSELTGIRVLITAGGTREAIDAMRFIGNASSGSMGYALAFEALRRGARVQLVSGPTHLVPPEQADTVRVTTAQQMRQAVIERVEDVDVLVMAAAVADWRPASSSEGKLSKGEGPPDLQLVKTADILAEVGSRRKAGGLPNLSVLVGFCAETRDLAAAAAAKLHGKALDVAVANEVGSAQSGPEVPTLNALVLDRDRGPKELGLVSKRALAVTVMDSVAARLAEAGPGAE
ncbi:MAG: bifunctional phosphopantothenoylcysteine decarboxylase/phosphopantothenate--cysteine ligase CoaBC [Actinobacteria bacterium]|nr:bifunctional phosphopantothenoylcysteine decarboxylase/phosphopantothenate--cysteine ligase CoaBC [Actinomycetota bacterium]